VDVVEQEQSRRVGSNTRKKRSKGGKTGLLSGIVNLAGVNIPRFFRASRPFKGV
jgi:hypothetical protein